MLRFLIFFCTSVVSIQLLHSAPMLEFLPTAAGHYSASASVHPDAAIVFTKSFEGEGSSFAAQAESALSKLTAALDDAGLDHSSVANVRGYLVAKSDEDLSEKMEIWNEHFTETFSSNPSPPTRTTIGVSRVLDEKAEIAIDAIIAAPNSKIAKFEKLLTNQRLGSFPSAPGETLRSVSPYSSLLITSGVLADPLTEGGTDFGDMSQQTDSALGKLERNLLQWGLNTGDLAYARILLSPPPTDKTAGLDLDGFQAGWEQFWSSKRSTPPPISALAAPGFNSSGRLIEIEFYAAFPDAAGPFTQLPNAKSSNPPVILRSSNPNSFLSSSVVISRDAKKIWFSGVISRDRKDIYGQGVEALLTLEERYADLGIDLSDTAQLRAYLNIEDTFQPAFRKWNRAYQRFFDHAVLNPEKPVRTAFPIENLPGGVYIEIETLAATRD